MSKNATWFNPPKFDSSCPTTSLAKNVPVEMRVYDKSHFGTAEASLELSGLPRIFLSCEFTEMTDEDMASIKEAHKNKKDEIIFTVDEHLIKDFTIAPLKDLPQIKLRLENSQDEIYGSNILGTDNTKIRKADFHLFNFMEIRGHDENNSSVQTLDMGYDDWKIVIKSFPDTEEKIHLLRNKGGYLRTHMGEIEYTGKSEFTGKELKECLSALCYALSFAKGGWCIPICPTGYGSQGKPVWGAWSAPLEAWSGPFRWFDAKDYSQLPIFFGGFVQKINNDKKWRRILYDVIGWYVNANNSVYLSKKGGIILAQAALEFIAYEHLTSIGVKPNKKEEASKRLNKFFGELGILNEIPKVEKLLQVSPDFAEALTRVRNSLAHRNDSHKSYEEDIYDEAWKLGLWCLELSILAVCDYHGTYKNRFTQETPTTVPWG